MTKILISSENQQKNFQVSGERWLSEVEQLKPLPVKKKPDEYVQAPSEKYTKPGLELSP
ncbi:hypothetical protein HC931_19845 [Candidatus Gracilibacteria bacterium]|nr:hypothetical protein [Candidatus Gracilibacteria bacterium]